MWYVHFRQLNIGDVYVGSTNDLKSYLAVDTEAHAHELESYFKSGSGKAIALKRLVRK